MNQVIDLAETLEKKAKARFERQRQEIKAQWQGIKNQYPDHTAFVEQLAGVFGKHKAIAVKDSKAIFKHGRFDPPKPGVLNPDNFKDMDYDWFAEVRAAHKRMNESLLQ